MRKPADTTSSSTKAIYAIVRSNPADARTRPRRHRKTPAQPLPVRPTKPVALSSVKAVDAMDDIKIVLDKMFVNLANTGSLSNSNLMKITTLALVDDYYDEMIGCDRRWKRQLDDLIAEMNNVFTC